MDKKMNLRRIFRALQGVNEEVDRYNSVLKKFMEAADDEWEPIVAVYRGDLQKGQSACRCAVSADTLDHIATGMSSIDGCWWPEQTVSYSLYSLRLPMSVRLRDCTFFHVLHQQPCCSPSAKPCVSLMCQLTPFLLRAAAFFEHMQCLLAAAKDDKDKLDNLVMVNTRLVALCANHDSIAADPQQLEQAAAVYR